MNIFIKLTRAVFGRITVSGENSDIVAAANALKDKGIQISELKKLNGGGASFSISGKDAKSARMILGGSVRAVNSGLPQFIFRYRKRLGLIIGALLGIAVIIFSGLFVWNIEIVGNQYISDEEILTCLEELGLRKGVRKSELDLHLISVEAELRMDRLAWLAINYKGTKAVVEMRETVPKPKIEDKLTPTNLVAARDGQVIYIEAVSGKAAVKRSDVVMEGQLLVSGIVDSPVFGFKSCRSIGKVIASTTRSFTVEVELQKDVKRYTGKTKTVSELSAFSFKLPLQKDKCDFISSEITETKKDLVLFSQIVLPVTLNQKIYKEYVTEKNTLSQEEAYTEAKRRLSELIDAECGSAIITNREESFTVEDNTAILVCTFDCIEDIAKEVPAIAN